MRSEILVAFLNLIFCRIHTSRICSWVLCLLWWGRKLHLIHSLALIYLLKLSSSSQFLSSFFNWFSKFVLCCHLSLITCFVYPVVDFRTSYLKSSNFNSWLKSDSLLVQKLRNRLLVRELLNFQNPLPLIVLLSFKREKSTREWSVELGASNSVMVTNSWRVLKIRMRQVYVGRNLNNSFVWKWTV